MAPRATETNQITERTPRLRKPVAKRQKTVTVAFRLDSFYIEKLERGASNYQISIHEYARQLLSDLLDRQEETRILQQLTQTQKGVERLRSDMALLAEALLTNITRADSKVVRNLVDHHLRRDDEE